MRRLIVVPLIAAALIAVPVAIWLAPRVEVGGAFSQLRWGLPVALGLTVGPAAFIGLLLTRWLYPCAGLPTVRILICGIPAICVAIAAGRLAVHTDLTPMIAGSADPAELFVHDDRIDLGAALAVGILCGALPVAATWRFIERELASRHARAARDAMAAIAIYGLAWLGTGIAGGQQAAIDARIRMGRALPLTAPRVRFAPTPSGRTAPPYWWCTSSVLVPGLLVRNAGFVAGPLDADSRQEIVVWLIYRAAAAGTITLVAA